MKVLDPGHRYALESLDGDAGVVVQFVCREQGKECAGTTNQEVLRALIDRVQYLEAQLHWDGNAKIIEHLRMALVLHEARVLERKVELGKIEPEKIGCGPDGHYVLNPEIFKEAIHVASDGIGTENLGTVWDVRIANYLSDRDKIIAEAVTRFFGNNSWKFSDLFNRGKFVVGDGVETLRIDDVDILRMWRSENELDPNKFSYVFLPIGGK